jgi:hypothetical protein
MDDDKRVAIGGMLGKGNRSTRRKPSSRTAFSTTNLTQPDPGLNLGRHGGKTRSKLRHGPPLVLTKKKGMCCMLSNLPCAVSIIMVIC